MMTVKFQHKQDNKLCKIGQIQD